jgi:hypothetical protein
VAGTFVVYGTCVFPSGSAQQQTNRRNAAATAIQNYAATNGLVPFAWEGYPAGVVNEVLPDPENPANSGPGFRFCYRAPTMDAAEAADAAGNQALTTNGYKGDCGHSET